MSVETFHAFQRKRPDGERWKRIGGRTVMMAPPTIVHQKIAGNLLRLLDPAPAVHDEELVAIPAPGVDLRLAADVFRAIGTGQAHAPEPDVAVIRDTEDPGPRLARAVVPFAEVVSSSDAATDSDGRAWTGVKGELCRAHRHCEAVLAIEQEKLDIHLRQRHDVCGTETCLADPGDELAVDCCGLRCRVADVDVRTHLAPPTRPPT